MYYMCKRNYFSLIKNTFPLAQTQLEVIPMTLLEINFSGAIFILAIVIIRAATISHLPKKTFLVLWETALIRFMLPFPLPSMFSVYTFVNRRISSLSLKLKIDHLTSAIAQEHLVTVQGAEQLPSAPPFSSFWPAVWCAGTILFALCFLRAYLRCRLEFRTSLPVSNAYAQQWLNERPLKRPLSIRQSDRISTPLTYGIFRPVILMPKTIHWEKRNELQYIFSHEYIHICRFDALTKLIAAFVLCIHWFNPFVWLLYLLLNRDMELACDESVIRQFGETSKSAYSLMLIRMEAEKSGLGPFCSNFNINATEERITAIMKTKQSTGTALVSACLLVFLTVSLFATSAAASHDSAIKDRSLFPDPQVCGKELFTGEKDSVSIVYESADILCYEDGAPYIHDVLTNNTDQTITETQYCMLAYDEKGSPLKLTWNFLDSSAEKSFELMVQSEEMLFPHQTEDYRGGWSLYDGEIMGEVLKVGNGEANQAKYALVCLKQVVFADGTVWKNPDFEDFLQTYKGKETGLEELKKYYPQEYKIE